MHRSRLKNIYIQKKNKIREKKKQINICVDLLRKTKIESSKNLNIENLCDNPQFWKTI